jgi:hypothetical protein
VSLSVATHFGSDTIEPAVGGEILRIDLQHRLVVMYCAIAWLDKSTCRVCIVRKRKVFSGKRRCIDPLCLLSREPPRATGHNDCDEGDQRPKRARDRAG